MAGPGALAVRLTLLVSVLCSVAARPVPGKVATPDYTLYHTKDGVFQAVREIVAKCPDMMRIDEDTQADGAYSSTLTVVTVEPAGLSPPGADHTGKLRLLLNFGEHGRELISSEIGLNVLRLLCDAQARAPLLAKYNIDPQALASALQRAVFKVVPMENVRGRERVEAGQLCERKNGRGVDPNRNWGVHWGFKEKDYDPAEEYPGAAAFSEPEAALLLRLARALRPHVWTSVHSGMDAIFMPYDHKAEIPEGPGAQATLEIITALNERTCRKKCATGSGGKSVGYLAHGTATDYMWQELHVPVPMTWEVYGDQRAAFEDCFRMFNPLSRQAYDATVEAWSAAVLTLLTLAPGHPEIAPELAAGSKQQQHQGQGEQQQQQQGQQQQGEQQRGPEQQGSSGGSGAVIPGSAAPREAAADGSGGNASSDKALEIAAALKQHMQQEGQQEQPAAVDQQDATEAAAAAEGVQRMLGVRRGAVPRQRGGRVVQALIWLVMAGAACVVASYLWSKPRFRYLLSSLLGKHLGLSRRRGTRSGLIPV